MKKNKKNPQDATLRNIRALRKRVELLEDKMQKLKNCLLDFLTVKYK